MSDQRKVMVCDECLRASCWYGELHCGNAVFAGAKVLKIAELEPLRREHPDNWSDEAMIKQYGNANREFPA